MYRIDFTVGEYDDILVEIGQQNICVDDLPCYIIFDTADEQK